VPSEDEPAGDGQLIRLEVSLAPPPPLSPVDRDWWHAAFARWDLKVDGSSHGPHGFQVWFEVRPDDLEDVARKVITVVREEAPSYHAEAKAREERRAADNDGKRQQMLPYQAILDRLMEE
jgi:hypothetical protein